MMTPTLLAWYFVVSMARLDVIAKRTAANKSDPNARSYNVTITAVRYENINPEYFGPGTALRELGPNEFGFRFNIIKAFPANVKMVAHTYEKNNRGVYVPSITVRESLCSEYSKQEKKQPLYKCFHYTAAGIKSCPFQKGVYEAPRVSCFSADCPAVMPGRHWRINKTWVTEGNVHLIDTIIEASIQRKSSSPLKNVVNANRDSST